MTDEPQYRDPGEPPVIDWIDVEQLEVDEAYQRQLDEARVNRILEWFDWRSFGALVVAPIADGRFNVVDGQHRAEAARRHPQVSTVPAVIIAASGTPAEAEVFVTVNRDRKNVTPLQLYWAELAAGDPDASTVAQVCERAGVVISRGAGGNPRPKPGETTAIAAVRSLVNRYGALRSRQMLEVLGRAKLAPIAALPIRAVEILLTDPEFKDEIDPEGLTDSIAGKAAAIEGEGRALAATHRIPLARAVASVWFKKTRKRRKTTAEPAEITRGEALRRAEAREAPAMDAAARRAAVADAGEHQAIADIMQAFGATPTEAKILLALLPGRLMSRAALHSALYGDDPDGGPDDKIIDVLLAKLRPKLDDHQIDVQTVRGMGYQLSGEMVRRADAVLRLSRAEVTA